MGVGLGMAPPWAICVVLGGCMNMERPACIITSFIVNHGMCCPDPLPGATMAIIYVHGRH